MYVFQNDSAEAVGPMLKPVSSKIQQTSVVLSCGHLCTTRMQGKRPVTLLDHGYSAVSGTPATTLVSAADSEIAVTPNTEQLSWEPESHSTPVKDRTESESHCVSSPDGLCDSLAVDQIIISFSGKLDPLYNPQNESDENIDCSDELNESDCVDECQKLVCVRKFVVFDSCLNRLFALLRCPVQDCLQPFDLDDITKDTRSGMQLKCTFVCLKGHTMQWLSQPNIGTQNVSAGNVLCAAATLFSGLTFTRLSQCASFFGLRFFF